MDYYDTIYFVKYIKYKTKYSEIIKKIKKLENRKIKDDKN